MGREVHGACVERNRIMGQRVKELRVEGGVVGVPHEGEI